MSSNVNGGCDRMISRPLSTAACSRSLAATCSLSATTASARRISFRCNHNRIGMPSPGCASASCTTTTTRYAVAAKRSQHHQIERAGMGGDRHIGTQRSDPSRECPHDPWRLHQAPEIARQALIRLDRQIAVWRRRRPRRISAPLDSDSNASVSGSMRNPAASSTAKRGAPPRRPHCQTSTRIVRADRSGGRRCCGRRRSRAAAVLLRAARHGVRAARMEMAAGRRRERGRDFALDRGELPLARLDARNFGEQRLRIGVVGAREKLRRPARSPRCGRDT